jgi:2-dehydro-3-deoxyphosphogluconate aldolase/(4S)-4-hydroxy-2-oxoglutarate aldolase
MVMIETFRQIHKHGIIPVISISSPENAPIIGQALLEAGLPCAEVTFRSDAAEDAIRVLAESCPEILVGAGTVLSIDQAERAIRAGARFIVSPGFDKAIVSWCIERDIVITPGVATPTEIIMALDCGLNVLKYFPAEAFGGIKTLKAISSPYKSVKFIPTGGINIENLADYLRLPAVLACGGSWIVAHTLIKGGRYSEITRRTLAALKVVRQVRSEGGG